MFGVRVKTLLPTIFAPTPIIETFFEKPRQMSKQHRELFKTLKAYYRIDPREWKAD